MTMHQELAGAVTVLAHGSDPVAVFGFFGPALLVVALVVTLVVRDRRRARDDGPDGRPTPPPAG